MNPMDTAPLDGQRVLIKRKTYAYRNRGYQHTGFQTLECWFDGKEWQEFCGTYETTSTDWIDPVGWCPMPEGC